MDLVHLIKLAAGADSVDSLAAWQSGQAAARGAAGLSPLPVCQTRHTPKRRAELLAGGSLYWVVRGVIAVRQRVLDIDSAVGGDGHRVCHLILDPDLIMTEPRPRKAFQGWRYLPGEDAPPDVSASQSGDMLPETVRRALMEAGAW